MYQCIHPRSHLSISAMYVCQCLSRETLLILYSQKLQQRSLTTKQTRIGLGSAFSYTV